LYSKITAEVGDNIFLGIIQKDKKTSLPVMDERPSFLLFSPSSKPSKAL
jgi:hypothetical protein